MAESSEAAPFGGHLTWGSRAALLCIDVARAYVEPSAPLYAPPFVAALVGIGALQRGFRAAGLPVLHTQVRYVADGSDGGQFFRKVPSLQCFVEGNPWGEFVEGHGPYAGEVVVTKQYASAFFGTSLASTLRGLGVDTLVVSGFSTSGCVRASGVDAIQHGFIPVVASDACGDREAGPHESNLFDLGSKYAEVMTTATILSHLELP